MFQLLDFTEARLASVTNRIEKHGDEDCPAVSLRVEITAANTPLDCIDPMLRQALYKAVPDQEELPGVEPTTPVLRCNSFDKIALTTAHEGWTLQLDDGADETTPMVFGGVKVDRFTVDAHQGGSVVLGLRLGTSDVDADKLGTLAMLNGGAVWIKVLQPVARPDAIDGTGAEFDADHPDAGDLFAAEHGDTDEDGGPEEDAEDDEGASTDAGDDGAEFEAGASAALAAAGVKPGRGKRAKALQ